MSKKFKRENEVEETISDITAEDTNTEAEEAGEELVDFEHWYSIREAAIPAQHHREILKADFKGQKVPTLATMAQLDNALKKYGVKLA